MDFFVALIRALLHSYDLQGTASELSTMQRKKGMQRTPPPQGHHGTQGDLVTLAGRRKAALVSR